MGHIQSLNLVLIVILTLTYLSFQDTTLTCTASGRGVIFLGDSNGLVHALNRQLQISSFRAHEEPIKIIHASDNSNLLLTVQVNLYIISPI